MVDITIVNGCYNGKMMIIYIYILYHLVMTIINGGYSMDPVHGGTFNVPYFWQDFLVIFPEI
jgi:hypothetical protein